MAALGVHSATVDVPDPQYVKTRDGAYIAYQVVGDGPVDIAWQFGHLGDIDLVWSLPWESTWFAAGWPIPGRRRASRGAGEAAQRRAAAPALRHQQLGGSSRSAAKASSAERTPGGVLPDHPRILAVSL